MSFPSAHRIYSSKYSVHVDRNSLNVLKAKKYHSHPSKHAKRLHRVSEIILMPACASLRLVASIVEPLPGKYKEHRVLGTAIRIAAFISLIVIAPFALVSALIGLPLRGIDHGYRPAMSYIDNSHRSPNVKTKENCPLTKDTPLHVRTHNLGFVPTSMSIAGDLCHPARRAQEVVDSIKSDPLTPDVIFFQESFNEEATKVLSNGIKDMYPYIIHSVAPHFSGFNSGSVIASKYFIEDVAFYRFGHMSGVEKMAPRGIARVRIESSNGPVLLYGIHTVALTGAERANARHKQIKDIRTLMALDLQKEPAIHQIVMGDFNTSHVDAWGKNNLEPANQAEAAVMKELDYFDDVYLRDHDGKTGVRVKENPIFLSSDNKRMKLSLDEPSGSWFHGPFSKKGLILGAKMHYERWRYDHEKPAPIKELDVKKATWGTRKWRKEQTANTARFDYILLQKQSQLDGRVEIRRMVAPKKASSASTDHLPVDGLFWVKNRIP